MNPLQRNGGITLTKNDTKTMHWVQHDAHEKREGLLRRILCLSRRRKLI